MQSCRFPRARRTPRPRALPTPGQSLQRPASLTASPRASGSRVEPRRVATSKAPSPLLLPALCIRLLHDHANLKVVRRLGQTGVLHRVSASLYPLTDDERAGWLSVYLGMLS